MMSYVTWLVRVSLPVILFWLWYQSQPDIGSWWPFSRESGEAHSRADLLKARRAVAGDKAPEAVRSLGVLDEATLEEKYGISSAKPAVAARRGGSGAQRNGKSKGKGKGKGDDEGGGHRGSGGGGEGGGAGPSELIHPAESPMGEDADANITGIMDDVGDDEGPDVVFLSMEERMQLDKVLNFVAFSYKDVPQRIFLPASAAPPRRTRRRP